MSVASFSRSALDALEVDYARFNAHKTVSTAAPSRFECFNVGPLSVTRDRNRADSYYNRILGLDATQLGARNLSPAELITKLDQALRLFDDPAFNGATVRVDVDVGHAVRATQASDALAVALGDRGFTQEKTVAWLWADADAAPVGPIPNTLRALTPSDHPALRTMLEYEGPVSDEIWELRRHQLFADTFKWMGIFDRDTLVAVASLWVAPNIAVFGSAQTLAFARRQGHQSALIRARFGQTSGRLVVDVEPGSTSQRNCERNGFAPLTLRQVWVRECADSAS